MKVFKSIEVRQQPRLSLSIAGASLLRFAAIWILVITGFGVVYTRAETTHSSANGSNLRAGINSSQNSQLSEATRLLQVGQLDEAETIVRKAIADSPHDAKAHVLLGVILDRRGRAADAENQYREALKLEPGNAPAL